MFKSLILTSLLVVSSSVSAEMWTAACNDGKNLQYNQIVNGQGLLYMRVEMPDGYMNTYQVARLEQTFFNGTAICGTVDGNGIGVTGEPLTQICANRDRRIVYIKYKHPHNPQAPMVSGVYCAADIKIEPVTRP